MSLPELCLRRPVATTTVVLAAIVVGLVSLRRLPLEYLPEIEGRSLTVQVSYPGSAPSEVERTIVRPLEEELASLQHLEGLTATATASGASVRVNLEAGADVDAAALEVRERIDRARARLPADVGRVQVDRWRSTDMPVLRCRVSPAEGTSPRALERFVDEVLAPRLGRVDGVGNVEVQGLAERRVLVELDRERLAQAGLTPAEVATLLRNRNRNASAGQLRAAGRVLSIRVLGELGDAAAVAALPIGRDRLLGDVAHVREETAPLERITRLDGREAITLRVSKESGANTITTCERVRAELEALLDSPAARGFRVDVFSDQSERILERLRNLQLSGLYGGLLLCAILYVFLRQMRSTLVVATTIPLSVVLTFALLYGVRALGITITLNVVSIMGLILGIGLVVDNGIVVLENIVRLREEGLSAGEAAARGAREVSSAVTAAMITSLIVFVPLLFSESRSARWSRDLGIVVCASVFCSLWVALSVVPLLAARALRGGPRPAAGPVVTPPPEGRAARAYTRLLRLTLRWRIALLVVLPLCGWQIHAFFSSVERSWGRGGVEREIDVEVEVPEAYSREERLALFARLEGVILAHREELDLENLTSAFRASAEAAPSGRPWRDDDELELLLRSGGDPSERKSVGEVRDRLRELLPTVPGVVYQLGSSRRMGGGGSEVRVLIEGRTSEELGGPAQAAAAVLATVEGVEEVQLDDLFGGAGLEVHPSIDRTARWGLGARAVGDAVAASLNERAVTRLRGRSREVDVVLRLEAGDRTSLDDLGRTRVGRAAAGLVGSPALEVASLADLVTAPAPQQIQREDRRAVVGITASVREGVEVRTVTEGVERTLAGLSLPRGVSWRLSEDLRRWRAAEGESAGAAGLAFVLVLIVLCALFESYIQPLVIAATVPFALVGVAWAFLATGTSLDDMAWIGLMILTGIVVNHGIVFVDRVNALLAEGVVRDEALVRAGRDRLRPILMTAATTVLGLLPIVGQLLFPDVFDADSGARDYGPIGLAVASGLVASTALTLLVLPALLSVAMDVQAVAWRLLGWTPKEAPR